MVLATATLIALVGLPGTAMASAQHSAGSVPLASTPASTSASASASTTASTDSWFHDPVTSAARRMEISVPTQPTLYTGPRRQTTSRYRTYHGSIAVPATWASGHDLAQGQALALSDADLFVVDSATTTPAARTELQSLTSTLGQVRAVRCEGYTDFTGSDTHRQTLSLDRARAICALVQKDRSVIAVSSVGYGGTDPVVVGGLSADRKQNGRVVILITSSAPVATVPSAPQLANATAGDTTATITFSAPTDDGGLAVSGYQVSTDGGANWADVATTGSSPFTVTVTGLTDGTTYPVSVRAVNAEGDSPASDCLDVTPAPAGPPAGNPWTTPDSPVISAALAPYFIAGNFYGDPDGNGPGINAASNAGTMTITNTSDTHQTYSGDSQPTIDQLAAASIAWGGTAVLSNPKATKTKVVLNLPAGQSIYIDLAGTIQLDGTDMFGLTQENGQWVPTNPAATGPAIRAFLAGYIQGEGNHAGKIGDDPTASHLQLLQQLLSTTAAYNVATTLTVGSSGYSSLSITDPTDWPKVQAYPFGTYYRCPGGAPSPKA